MRSALESVAAYGSVSFGLLPPARLRAVLLGEVPSAAERVQIHQALTETAPYRLATLARELCISIADLWSSGRRNCSVEASRKRPHGHARAADAVGRGPPRRPRH